MGGRYPRFVAFLASAAGLAFNPAKVPETCREVRRALTATAGSKSRDQGERAKARGQLLKPHVIGHFNEDGEPDPDGGALVGGYEPAPDRSPGAARRVFAAALRSARKRR